MLLIDAGNTRIKVAYSGEFDQAWFVVREGATGDALNRKVIKLLDGAHKPPRRVLLGCVADSALADMFADQCRIRWGVEAEKLMTTTDERTRIQPATNATHRSTPSCSG